MRSVLVLLVVLAACRDEAPPAPLKGPFVVLKQDGRVLAAVPITHTISLTELVPTVPRWLLVEATAADGRYMEVAEPATTYPGAEIRLDFEHGHITIGVFNPPVTGVPLSAQPLITLSEVTEIDVLTRPRPRPPAAKGLEVVASGRAHEMTSDALEELTEPRPRPRIRGWAVRDVIDAAVPDASYARVRIIGEGAEQSFSRDELSGSASVLLKLNQRGQYMLQVWDANGPERPRIQVRGVTKLVLEPPT